ncbi:cytochrome c biogenesis protein DipZ [Ferrovibrio xuzhouensis]|uniref:Cytochrome c biogenesis protein DipZ n=1 Tax=Ferrovibrio xuzhouensis TaxID=1576914 RepID=A0ABV7VJ69_9PROT
MTLLILAYAAGLLTIATPCILPVLPFVLARVGLPFRRGGLPMLLGLAIAFAAVASLASVAGHWAVAANHYGRGIALAVMALFGLTLLVPAVADRLLAPLAALGGRLSQQAEGRATAGASLLLGLATGLVWAPCAGPVLGLILTGAALRGPNADTALLLLTYAAGAATALAAGLLFGGRLLAMAGRLRTARWSDGLRRLSGATVIAGVVAIWSGLDVGLFTRLSSAGTTQIENCLLALIGDARAAEPGEPRPRPLTGPQAALLGAQQWLNTAPLRPQDLQGKVVLVNFWTYSCINCLRVLPHVRAWAEKYRDSGLVVIGVHTPEFAFEKDAGNVQKALGHLGIHYPVAIDNDFGIWRAFGNVAWPGLYFIDAHGQVRHRVLGEGRYDDSERLIQTLLSEARAAPVAMPLGGEQASGAQVAPDESDLHSGETYVGYAQTRGFASPGGQTEDTEAFYRAPATLRLNHWGLGGSWTVGGEFATLNGEAGRIVYRFHARDLHLVMGPPAPGQAMRFRVTIDGAAPGADHGADVDAEGWGSLQDTRLYQLVRQSGDIADRTFAIEFEGAGVRAYAFTFG